MSEHSTSARIPLPVVERWLPIPGFENYSVSDCGRVRREAGKGCLKTRLLKPRDSFGYQMVSLCRSGLPNRHGVHRLVLLAFVGPAPAGHQCCHKDGTRTNNRLENQHYCAKLTDADIPEIRRRVAAGEDPAIIASEKGVSRTAIVSAARGRTWRHVP